MLKFFRLPFATSGDKTAIPDAVDTNGNVSYTQGYGFDYQRQKTDPAAKNIERDKMNQVLFDITTAIAEIQAQGVPDFITTALNGGAAYSYAQYAIVRYSGELYISLVATNTALPSDATKWALLPTPALLQQAAYMSANAGGTVDAITAAFAPTIAALPAAPGTLSVFVRAGGANATTTPTFKADTTTAKTIVKGANLPLVPGDIAGAGHWLELQYDATLDKWVLQNPAFGFGGTPAQFDNTTKPASTAFVRQALGALSGFNSVTASATLNLAQLGSLVVFNGSTAAQTITLPALATIPNGYGYYIQNIASVPVTIKGNASEPISYNGLGVGASSGNTMVLGVGDSTFITSAVSGWYEQQGVRSQAVSSFACSAQTWQDVTGSRAVGTVYTNSTGRPIAVTISLNAAGATGFYTLSAAGSVVDSQNITSGFTANFFAIVPAGATYTLSKGGGDTTTGLNWKELR